MISTPGSSPRHERSAAMNVVICTKPKTKTRSKNSSSGVTAASVSTASYPRAAPGDAHFSRVG